MSVEGYRSSIVFGPRHMAKIEYVDGDSQGNASVRIHVTPPILAIHQAAIGRLPDARISYALDTTFLETDVQGIGDRVVTQGYLNATVSSMLSDLARITPPSLLYSGAEQGA